ncbi:MAG: hypothetical protein CMG71_07415 [Candidatus Marinimicrobia bacterium]|nr:hypothetical protein [Candidatus Neomarinimicrobiota bacterium]
MFIILFNGGCTNNNEPLLDELVSGVYKSRIVTNYEVNGMRDGATTQVFIKILLENGERVQLNLEIVYNPTPILRSGSWQVDGKQSGSGNVMAKSIRFLGGQGDSPSLGGRFELKEGSRSRFRVVVPLRPVNKQSL